MPLLDKITKSSMLISNICPKGGLLLLNRPKCGSNVTIVRIGLLGRGTTSGKRGKGGQEMLDEPTLHHRINIRNWIGVKELFVQRWKEA